jgi:hypothetical protein
MARLKTRLAARRATGPLVLARVPMGHRRLAKRRHDPVKVARAVGAVGVGEDDQLTLGGQHPGPHGEPLATVGMVRQHPNPPINRRDGVSHHDGGIGRAVIDHQHLDLARDP